MDAAQHNGYDPSLGNHLKFHNRGYDPTYWIRPSIMGMTLDYGIIKFHNQGYDPTYWIRPSIMGAELNIGCEDWLVPRVGGGGGDPHPQPITPSLLHVQERGLATLGSITLPPAPWMSRPPPLCLAPPLMFSEMGKKTSST
ncbi:hypothetical protein J6590_074409 [Homalodisca vitripennis]|nr:hypothetical protein J6590_074409 [Homalodisca vitripennis]